MTKAFKQPQSDVTGKFLSPYSENRGNPIALRLPLSLDGFARKAAEERGKSVQAFLADLVAAAASHPPTLSGDSND